MWCLTKLGNHQSDIVPDNSNVLETKLVNERMNVLREFGTQLTRNYTQLVGTPEMGALASR